MLLLSVHRLEHGKTVFIPKYRPFERCRDVINYKRENKLGQGTFGYVISVHMPVAVVILGTVHGDPSL